MSLASVIAALYGKGRAALGAALDAPQTDADPTGDRATVGYLKRELAEHPSYGLTPAGLYAILARAEAGDLRGQHELAADMEDKDPQIQSDIGKRRQAAAERDWAIVGPADASPLEQRATDQAREIFEGLEVEDLIIELGDGILHGWVNLLQPWAREGTMRVVQQPIWEPHGHFQLHPDNQNLLTLRDSSARGEALWPLGWVEHRHRAKSGYVARMGLLRVLFWPYLFQNYALGDLAELLEILGIPVRLGKYPSTATPDEKRTLLRAITQIGHSAAGIIPQSMSLELLAAASGSEKPFEAMLNWAERAKSKVVLGGTLTTGTDAGSGAMALGNVHERGLDSLVASDIRQYQSTIRRFMLWPMAAMNYGILDLRRAPRLQIDTGDPADLALYAEALPKLISIGMRIGPEWAHGQLHIPQAPPGAAILTLPATPAPAAPTALAALSAPPPAAPQTPIGLLTDTLTRTVQPGVDAWVERLDALLADASTLEEARGFILSAFGTLPKQDQADAFAAAAVAIQAAGRYDVQQESA